MFVKNILNLIKAYIAAWKVNGTIAGRYLGRMLIKDAKKELKL